MHAYTHIYIHTYTHTYRRLVSESTIVDLLLLAECDYLFTYVCKYICIHTHTCMHTHTHIHTHTYRRLVSEATIVDLFLLAECDYFIGTLSSHYGALAYELSYAQKGYHVPYISLDYPWSGSLLAPVQ